MTFKKHERNREMEYQMEDLSGSDVYKRWLEDLSEDEYQAYKADRKRRLDADHEKRWGISQSLLNG